jgi:hypothetical protein
MPKGLRRIHGGVPGRAAFARLGRMVVVTGISSLAVATTGVNSLLQPGAAISFSEFLKKKGNAPVVSMITGHLNRSERTMLTVYRIIYGLTVALFLANVLATNYLPSASGHLLALLIALPVSLCSLLTLVIGFSRIRPPVFWGLVLIWLALFVWYGWFSPASPFLLHESHSLNSATAAKEQQTHNLVAGSLFIALVLWFLSLPMTRSFYGRQQRTGKKGTA